MRLSGLLTASALGAGLLILPAAGAAQTKPAPAAPAAKPAAPPAVDPASVEALGKMSAYLRTLNSFELKAVITEDDVDDEGRKLQIGGTAIYKVRKPNGFTIDLVSDRKIRKLYYDGKTMTLSAPRVGYYAQATAPATIRETLALLDEKYGVEVPLQDLFRWGEPGDHRADLTEGFYVGPARLDGVETDQYAYSTGDLDWQIWIERGDKPAPRKIVITDTSDPVSPQFEATLTWTANPAFKDADFAFTPPAGANKITFGSTGARAEK